MLFRPLLRPSTTSKTSPSTANAASLAPRLARLDGGERKHGAGKKHGSGTYVYQNDVQLVGNWEGGAIVAG